MCAAVIMDGTVVTLLRPDDMLVLDLRFVNLRRTEDEGGATVLMPADAAAPAFIEVTSRRRRSSRHWESSSCSPGPSGSPPRGSPDPAG